MPKIKYAEKRFDERKILAIQRANRICRQWAAQGYDLTLRQLYYQFVASDWLPNTVQSYKWLGDLISDARLAGLIDWDHIVDRTRNLRSVRHFDDPADAMDYAAEHYWRDLWYNQPNYVEVWVEKDALSDIVGQAATAQDCPYFSCRGYTSQSELWGAGRRIGAQLRRGRDVIILHLGDHDPSGIDMTRDIRERMMMFINKDNTQVLSDAGWRAAEKIGISKMASRLGDLPEPHRTDILDNMRRAEQSWGSLTVNRIALNRDQIDTYDPPPNPAKVTDPRAKGYIREHGEDSWELDALRPDVLDTLIRDEIERYKDPVRWNAAYERQEADRASLAAISDHWTEVMAHARSQGWVT